MQIVIYFGAICPRSLSPSMFTKMNKQPIIFALANLDPEIIQQMR